MSAKKDRIPRDADDLGELVPAVFTQSAEEAEEYAQLLEDHDVPAEVDDEYDGPRPRGRGRGDIAVLVPESHLEEARIVIAEFEGAADVFVASDELDDEDEEEELDLVEETPPVPLPPFVKAIEAEDEEEEDEELFGEEEEEEEEKEEDEEEEDEDALLDDEDDGP